MTDEEWVDLFTHVCTTYDDMPLKLYLVGRIREGTARPAPFDFDATQTVVTVPEPVANGHAHTGVTTTPSSNGHHDRLKVVPRKSVGQAKFTDDEVREIRRRFHTKEATTAEMAAEANTSIETMRQIVRRDSYKHIEPIKEEIDAERDRRHQARREAAAGAIEMGSGRGPFT